jgi:hypothetical protein
MLASHGAGQRELTWLTLAGILFWLGECFHDFRQFADSHGLTPDSIGGGVVLLCLLVVVRCAPHRRLLRVLLLIFTLVVAVGTAVSVLPAPFWPFVPEQSLSHYATHVVVLAMQLPFVALALRGMTRVGAMSARGSQLGAAVH